MRVRSFKSAYRAGFYMDDCYSNGSKSNPRSAAATLPKAALLLPSVEDPPPGHLVKQLAKILWIPMNAYIKNK